MTETIKERKANEAILRAHRVCVVQTSCTHNSYSTSLSYIITLPTLCCSVILHGSLLKQTELSQLRYANAVSLLHQEHPDADFHLGQ